MTAVIGSIRNLKERVLGLNLTQLIVNTANQTSDKIIQLNQIQLYRSSIDAFGNRLALYSSPLYAFDKNRSNPLPGVFHPDLYLTGDFYKGFKVAITQNANYSVYSTDAKADKLSSTGPGGYGPGIFGLTKSNMQIYARETFFPEFAEGFTAATGLIFR